MKHSQRVRRHSSRGDTGHTHIVITAPFPVCLVSGTTCSLPCTAFGGSLVSHMQATLHCCHDETYTWRNKWENGWSLNQSLIKNGQLCSTSRLPRTTSSEWVKSTDTTRFCVLDASFQMHDRMRLVTFRVCVIAGGMITGNGNVLELLLAHYVPGIPTSTFPQ